MPLRYAPVGGSGSAAPVPLRSLCAGPGGAALKGPRRGGAPGPAPAAHWSASRGTGPDGAGGGTMARPCPRLPEGWARCWGAPGRPRSAPAVATHSGSRGAGSLQASGLWGWHILAARALR